MITSFEQDQALQIANEIMAQPTAWKHIVKIIREQKEDLKEFIDPLLKKEDLDLLLIGADDRYKDSSPRRCFLISIICTTFSLGLRSMSV